MGLRKPGFLRSVAALLGNGREGIAATLGRISGGKSTAPEIEALAAVLLACLDGLALQKLAEPEDFDIDAAYHPLTKMA